MDASLIIVCPMCQRYYPIRFRSIDMDKYYKGALAQNAFPSPLYTATERESIISCLCPNCQKKIFG